MSPRQNDNRRICYARGLVVLIVACTIVISTIGEIGLANHYGRGLGEVASGFAIYFLSTGAGIGIFWIGISRYGGKWRMELEGEVADRTLELELRNAFLRVLNVPSDDEKSYREVLGTIMGRLVLKSMLLAYYDGRKSLQGIFVREGDIALRPLGSDEVAALGRASRGEDIELPFLGADRAVVAFGLQDQGEQCGFVAMTRAGAPFGAEERKILSTVFASFSVHARMQKEKARQEWVRRETEQALRRSEERLRTFFEESRDMIYSTNADDVVASINDTGLALLGVSDRFEVVGRPFTNHVLSIEDRHFYLKKLREQGYITDYECVFKRADGTTVFCLESAHAVKDKNGSIIEVQGIVKDISERIANERELWQANLELADANEKLKSTQMIMIQHEKLASIGQLAAGIAHEINNPVGFLSSNQATLKGYLDVLRKAWIEAKAMMPDRLAEVEERLDLNYILEEIEALIIESDEGFKRIIDIVQNLKSFARAESTPVMSPYDLEQGIKSSLAVARNELKYVTDIELDLAPMPPIRAMGGEINQVILNILVNAAQAIEAQKRKEKGSIRVVTRLEGDWAVLEIDDDGPGIPEEYRLKVFDPFYTTKEPGKGTGLGLSISYDIITRKHKGSIAITNSPLGGARFTILLPVLGPPTEEAPPEA